MFVLGSPDQNDPNVQRFSIWVHGTIGEPAFVDKLVPSNFNPTPVVRDGTGAKFTQLGGTENLDQNFNIFHFALPSVTQAKAFPPAPPGGILNPQVPTLEKVFVLFRTGGGTARIVAVQLFDGPNLLELQQFLNLELTGDHSRNIDAVNTFVLPSTFPLGFGLDISVLVKFSKDLGGGSISIGGEITFATVGADFIIPGPPVVVP